MITQSLMTAGKWILSAILNVLDILPNFPEGVITALDDYLDLVFSNLSILPFFFPVSFGLSILSIVFVMSNWKRIYHFILWVWHKVPLSSD